MEEYMKDQKGRLVPSDMVKPVDKARDDLVQSITEEGLALSEMLKDFKARALTNIRAFLDLSAEQYHVEMGGKKGNVTLVSFDGKRRVLIAVDERITFDERLQIAKALIDECLKEWTQGARHELKALVDDAFAVDKQGKINTHNVLRLRRLEISDEKWLRAMEAISDSITVTQSKDYIRLYQANDKGEFDLISLDIAS
ncbi:MAG TPA: DUF3164 family protein [Rectinemataceae bacterium]|nr:DUF3164 family protein [Rectinemataceae bacterium]